MVWRVGLVKGPAHLTAYASTLRLAMFSPIRIPGSSFTQQENERLNCNRHTEVRGARV